MFTYFGTLLEVQKNLNFRFVHFAFFMILCMILTKCP
jgi:hypothetical protein